jgi:hypothetical protein
VAGGTSRRGALKAFAGAVGGVVAGAFGARPEPASAKVPVWCNKPGAAPGKDTFYMFVQSATSGTFVENPVSPGLYRLTLHGVGADTVYFSDRPVRDAGTTATQRFLAGVPFSPTNPPNAALVAASGRGPDSTLVIEIFSPRYDGGTKTLTYDARILPDYKGDGLAVFAGRQTGTLPASFDDVSLFIDDCPDGQMLCWPYDCPSAKDGDNCPAVQSQFQVSFGCCWSWSKAYCEPCNSDLSGICQSLGYGGEIDGSSSCTD